MVTSTECEVALWQRAAVVVVLSPDCLQALALPALLLVVVLLRKFTDIHVMIIIKCFLKANH